MNDLPHLEAKQVQNYANFSTPQNMAKHGGAKGVDVGENFWSKMLCIRSGFINFTLIR